MELTIQTKYNIGQKVYLKKTDIKFSTITGDFINIEVSDPIPYTITSIEVQINSEVNIYYKFDGRREIIKEDEVFSSLEEVIANCKNDSK